ncbi:hypothetical protein SAMN04488144_1403 [Methylobacterium sp. 190mf]|nr:hypothetical protein SAMN04488144_1403 [Methylobacterium sp. 190mf]
MLHLALVHLNCAFFSLRHDPAIVLGQAALELRSVEKPLKLNNSFAFIRSCTTGGGDESECGEGCAHGCRIAQLSSPATVGANRLGSAARRLLRLARLLPATTFSPVGTAERGFFLRPPLNAHAWPGCTSAPSRPRHSADGYSPEEPRQPMPGTRSDPGSRRRPRPMMRPVTRSSDSSDTSASTRRAATSGPGSCSSKTWPGWQACDARPGSDHTEGRFRQKYPRGLTRHRGYAGW